MTDPTAGSPPTPPGNQLRPADDHRAGGPAAPEPTQELRAVVEAVTATRYHGQPSLAEVDALLAAARAVLPAPACQYCGSAVGPVRRTAETEHDEPQVVCVNTQACATRRGSRDWVAQNPARALVALMAAVVHAARDQVRPGAYDSTHDGRLVRVEIVREYEYCLTYPDGAKRYRNVGTSREVAEAVAQSPTNWDPPGQPGTVADRLVVHIHGPWDGHPDGRDQAGTAALDTGSGGAR